MQNAIDNLYGRALDIQILELMRQISQDRAVSIKRIQLELCKRQGIDLEQLQKFERSALYVRIRRSLRHLNRAKSVVKSTETHPVKKNDFLVWQIREQNEHRG